MTEDDTKKGPVFVVDDEPAIRDSLRIMLTARGYLVHTFDSGASFLRTSAGVDRGCLLVDMMMPDMTGLELQSELAVHGIDIPVCFITGHADVPKAVQAMKAGAIDFVQKPYTNDQLVESIEHALAVSSERRSRAREEADASDALATLTDREYDVLAELMAGNPNKVAAANIGISPRTVEKHRARIMEKLGAHSLSQVIQIAMTAGVDGRGQHHRHQMIDSRPV